MNKLREAIQKILCIEDVNYEFGCEVKHGHMDVINHLKLGKQSTLEDLLRAMYKNDDENYSNWTFIQGIAGDNMIFEYHNKEIKGFIYDLSKTPEEQPEEVQDMLVKLLSHTELETYTVVGKPFQG